MSADGLTDGATPVAAREVPESERGAVGDVLSFVAHEFRTPMTAVVAMTDLLRDTQLDPDQRDMVEVVRRSAQGLVDMVGNVLEFARLRTGKLDLDTQPFSLSGCVEECIDLLGPQAADKGLELCYTIDAATPDALRGDPVRLRQILINLIGNAVKFTDAGEVAVFVTSESVNGGWCQLHVAVADTGPGIPEDRLSDVFRKFTQIGHAAPARHEGSGLGLSICRQLTELMGGRIWVESELGRGSTFHVTARMQPTDATGPSLDQAHPALTEKRVLIVDDNATVCRLMADLVGRWGVEPQATTRPSDALQRLRTGRPYDAVLIDRHLPAVDGQSLPGAIRQLPNARSVPLILLTTVSGESPRDAGTAAGGRAQIAAYLHKPVKPARLKRVLLQVLGDGGGKVAAAPAPEAGERPEPVDPTAGPEGGARPERAAPRQVRASADRPTDGRAEPRRPGSRELEGVVVLVADDGPEIRRTLRRLMGGRGAQVTGVGDGERALDEVRRLHPDVVILDAVMPKLDGFQVCRTLKEDPDTRLTPVVMVTGLHAADDRVRGIEAGADDVLVKPFNSSELLARVQMLAQVKRFTDTLERVDTVLVALARCIEGRDPHTHGHCERLSDYASNLGRILGLGGEEIDALRLAGIVHDIGKVAVPDAILLKPGRLTEAEWAVMREHPVTGERICSKLTSLRRVLPIIRHHHEKMDGSGYPDGLTGLEIPVTARVLQIVDVYDALTTARSYKPAATPAWALRLMEAEVERGWWDPEIFEIFRTLVLSRQRAACAPYRAPRPNEDPLPLH